MRKLKKLVKTLGPGFITGASDDDPSGIATYSQTGALFGYSQLWTALFTFPFMTVIQEMCGRIGLVTGKGLSGILRHHYPRWTLYAAVLLLIMANFINIGTDLGAMAVSAQLVFGRSFIFWLLVLVTLILILEIFVSYKSYVKYLKFLTFSLFAYVFTAFFVRQDWPAVLTSTLLPTFDFTKEYLMNIVAILGTTISPYLFFWQTSEEVEEEIAHHKLRSFGAGIPRIAPRDITDMRRDTIIGMFFSNLIMFFIILTAASTLNRFSITNINTADEAALALKPLAGDLASIIFGLGIVGTGLLAVPILAGSASYALSEIFGWKAGLYRKANVARGFYGVIIAAIIIGIFINFIGINPIKALYYTAIINGIASPLLIVFILFIANNKKIMGSNTNKRLSNLLGVLIAIVMAVAAFALLWQLLG